MTKEIYLTAEKIAEMKEELNQLKTVRRAEIVARIQDALSLRDLKENSEYQAAKEEQSQLEGTIEEMEYSIKHAKIIKEGHSASGAVAIGNTVVAEVNGQKVSYTIVGSAEVDVMKGKISNESPIGRAMLGKKKGDVIEVMVPAGKMTYKIHEVK
ncbi:MAG: transcription elongation factor GreA [Patescibacteria group bacterium]